MPQRWELHYFLDVSNQTRLLRGVNQAVRWSGHLSDRCCDRCCEQRAPIRVPSAEDLLKELEPTWRAAAAAAISAELLDEHIEPVATVHMLGDCFSEEDESTEAWEVVEADDSQVFVEDAGQMREVIVAVVVAVAVAVAVVVVAAAVVVEKVLGAAEEGIVDHHKNHLQQ